MEKKILVLAVYISMAGTCAIAQNKKHPAPPAPPAAPVEFVASAPPPPPPPPPIPPVPPAVEEASFISPVIVNNNGYEISVETINGNGMVYVRKNGVSQKIKLSTWNADRKSYEKKYGQLPPLPLPPAAPVIKQDTGQ